MTRPQSGQAQSGQAQSGQAQSGEAQGGGSAQLWGLPGGAGSAGGGPPGAAGVDGGGSPAPPDGGSLPQVPAVSLPKGGGAVRGIGEKFAANPVTGTATLTVPVPTSPGRGGFGPSLSLTYDSGAGNGPFGIGWRLSLPSITRKTDRGLPRYADDQRGGGPQDVFVLSDAEDLVPVRGEPVVRTVDGRSYRVQRYRPRVEGLFARIERWCDPAGGAVFWRSTTPDNVTTTYGRTAASRVADPADPGRIYQWLVCESVDGRGNAIVYDYLPEDGRGVDPDLPYERCRGEAGRSAGRQLKRVRYGNRLSQLARPDLADGGWLFEVVFDYGDHAGDAPEPEPSQPWPVRLDPFSTCRPGFEVRGYRLCQRVLMFHHFGAEPDVGEGCLVRSLDLRYRGEPGRGEPLGSFLASIEQAGYRRTAPGRYLRRALPALELEYTPAELDATVHQPDGGAGADVPPGVGADPSRWVDLDGTGLPGVLTERAGAWYFAANSGGGRLAPARPVSPIPAAAVAGGPQTTSQLMDLAGTGRLDLVEVGGRTPGYHRRDPDGAGWEQFRPFPAVPVLDWTDPSLRLLDLTGDGTADVAVGEAQVWYPSAAYRGFGPGRRLRGTPDPGRMGPLEVLCERDQSLHLADMAGDGLTDLVRVRNGEVSYWPNLGHGRFGPQVVMAGAPLLDEPDRFDQRRLRLVDVDGSGTTDLLYLHPDGVRVYRNLMGNAWSPAEHLPLPWSDALDQVVTADLLGTGTACLVWPAPAPGGPPRHLDLLGGRKPHLLCTVRNNLGAERTVEYAPSTRFHLADAAAGRPWATRLPFPVHVVSRVETRDLVGGHRLVNRYAYHHGCFDPVERAFHGFGMVEQWDCETIAAVGAGVDAAVELPPVLTRTWYHPGVLAGGDRVSRVFEAEYHREDPSRGPGEQPLLLPDTLLPDSPAPLGTQDQRQAVRALKGAMLRQEVYALDGSPAAGRPYLVVERNYTVKLLQPAQVDADAEVGHPPYAVMFVHPRESITARYERQLYPGAGGPRPDPRIEHHLVLAVDEVGNVLRAATVGLGRRQPGAPLPTGADGARQRRIRVLCTDTGYTNGIDEPGDHRGPAPAHTRMWEVSGLTPRTAGPYPLFGFDELAIALRALDDGHADTPAGHDEEPGQPRRRLVQHSRTLYRRDDLTGALPLGRLEPRGIPFESYRLVFTPELLAHGYGERVDPELLRAGGYVTAGGGWWAPSGRHYFTTTATDAATELAQARRHCYLPARFEDPFGGATTVAYDRYDLLVAETADPVGNRVTVGLRDPGGAVTEWGHDYRVLQPRLVTDANRNVSRVAFDALGLVVGTAVAGKPEQRQGDTLDGFVADLDPATARAALADPLANQHALLQGATTRLVYDLAAPSGPPAADGRRRPAAVYTLARETHTERPLVRHTFAYSDGFGRVVQQKGQAEGGSPDSPRWLGTGWTVFDNKGNPVRRFEPFFSATHHFEAGRRHGVATAQVYDPFGRPVARLHPDGSWEKAVVHPWHQHSWDRCDTVTLDPAADPDIGPWVALVLAAMPGWRTWYQRCGDEPAGRAGRGRREAAAKAAAHAGTPASVYVDALGHPFLTVADAGPDETGPDETGADETGADETTRRHVARTWFDARGNPVRSVDPLGRTVVRYRYDLLGGRIHQASLDAGERWLLTDAVGGPFCSWDGRGHRSRVVSDAARRPTGSYLRIGDDPEVLVGRTEYGEDEPDAEARNLRGRAVRVCDQAGTAISEAYDFKGNLLASSRRLAVDYRSVLDWSAEVALEPEEHRTATAYDALNRPVAVTTPDGSTALPDYNEAGLPHRLRVRLAGAPEPTPYLLDTEYDARGQRTRMVLGNGITVRWAYDPETLRLVRHRAARDGVRLQDLRYTYDPVGNVTHVVDTAQPVLARRNRRVEPAADYTYDALYRLVAASGREHLGQPGPAPGRPPGAADPGPAGWPGTPAAGDDAALSGYVERYTYDAVGNLLRVAHRGADPTHAGWTRDYTYAEPSPFEPDAPSNRLSATSAGGPAADRYAYDTAGNVTAMPHLPLLVWDFRDQLRATATQVVSSGTPETTWYVYDSAGRRVRKVTDAPAAPGAEPRRRHETRYLGGLDVHREYGTDPERPTLERQSLHLTTDHGRLALVETRTVGTSKGPRQLARYQLADHLDSSVLELDEQARILSYEEYYPYGGTSYRAASGLTDAPKRYRFTGRERDEESGLYHHGARYYAPWLGRWTSCDPAGLGDGVNLYGYAGDNPIAFADPTGTQCDSRVASCIDPSAPTAADEQASASLPESHLSREDLEQRSIPEEHPAPPPPPHDGPSIRAETPDEAHERMASRFMTLDLPPSELPPEAYDSTFLPGVYTIAYGLKHSIYTPIREWVSPTPIHYLDSNQQVREYTGPRDHSDAIPAIAQILLLFTPTPKGVGMGVAADDALVAGVGGGADYLTAVASPRMVVQELNMSCGPACARQLLSEAGVEVTEASLREAALFSEQFGTEAGSLARAMQQLHPEASYAGGGVAPEALGPLTARGSFIARIRPSTGPHMVIVDGVEGGIVRIRDPWGLAGPGSELGLEGTMTLERFMELWNRGINQAVFRR